MPAPLTPFGEELRQKSFRDGVRSLRLLIREEMDKPLQNMPHTHNPDVQPEHQREYCWRCKIERVLDSQIEGYKVHCSHADQEVPAEQREAVFETIDGEQQTNSMVLRNLAMLIRRLAHKHPNQKLKEQALKYLEGEGLQGSVLRADQEVPAEQRQRTSTIAMGKMKPTELMAHEISLPEGELEQWYENPAAQPASAAKPPQGEICEHEEYGQKCFLLSGHAGLHEYFNRYNPERYAENHAKVFGESAPWQPSQPKMGLRRSYGKCSTHPTRNVCG